MATNATMPLSKYKSCGRLSFASPTLPTWARFGRVPRLKRTLGASGCSANSACDPVWWIERNLNSLLTDWGRQIREFAPSAQTTHRPAAEILIGGMSGIGRFCCKSPLQRTRKKHPNNGVRSPCCPCVNNGHAAAINSCGLTRPRKDALPYSMTLIAAGAVGFSILIQSGERPDR